MVPISWEEFGVLALEERSGGEDSIGVPGFEELEGLPDVFSVNHFGLNELPYVRVLHHLLGCQTIWG